MRMRSAITGEDEFLMTPVLEERISMRIGPNLAEDEAKDTQIQIVYKRRGEKKNPCDVTLARGERT